eukprot:6633536-Alexandrium_andersonii.AAC.1
MVEASDGAVAKERLRLRGRVPWREERGASVAEAPGEGFGPEAAVPWQLKCGQCGHCLLYTSPSPRD